MKLHTNKDALPLNTGSVKDSTTLFDNEIKWFTSKEAAEYLRISVKCLLNLVSNGHVPHYKFGRRNRYLESELRQVLMANPKGERHGI